ncbi:hypothetical protein BDV95DRAFT_569387 [Massariosphaeria phaeospora]|uniref:Uncharacterized protein n=1 Tax=Massariosphaeria phaeospora TaxID=100035 RepID=A0A7C8MLP9_9PLEO|nr:hypothetical protein BDV95DRAFT_569387 [Massariosphaeria phaeospora]
MASRSTRLRAAQLPQVIADPDSPLNYTPRLSRRAHHTSWNHYTIGNHVISSDAERSTEAYPSVIVDICTKGATLVYAVVARLYDHSAALDRIDQGVSAGPGVSALSCPHQSHFVISNDFEAVHFQHLAPWNQNLFLQQSVSSDVYFNLSTQCVDRLPDAASDIKKGLEGQPHQFAYFMKLPREIRDLIYQAALENPEDSTNHFLAYRHSRPVQFFETPGLLGPTTKQVHHEVMDCLYRTKTPVLVQLSRGRTRDKLGRRLLHESTRFQNHCAQLTLAYDQVFDITYQYGKSLMRFNLPLLIMRYQSFKFRHTRASLHVCIELEGRQASEASLHTLNMALHLAPGMCSLASLAEKSGFEVTWGPYRDYREEAIQPFDKVFLERVYDCIRTHSKNGPDSYNQSENLRCLSYLADDDTAVSEERGSTTA